MLVVDGEESGDVLEVDEKVAHGLAPAAPTSPLLQLKRVDPEIHYLVISWVDDEGHPELFRIFHAFCLQHVLAEQRSFRQQGL